MGSTPEKKGKNQKRAGLPFLTAEDILNVGKCCMKEESPINLSFDIMKEIRLAPLEWENFNIPPKLMKISNSGTTAILSAKWHGPRPYLANGPVSGKYVFSQLHFHWGRTFQEGSEHRVNGEALPLEVHAMFFKNVYISQDDAMKRTDGIVTMAYFFNLQEEDNANLQPITEVLPEIAIPLTSQHMRTVPLDQFLPSFSNDYFLYWGNVVNMNVLWFICRKPLGISQNQLSLFQKLIGSDKKPIEKNFREPRDLNHRVVFHVNPSEHKSHPLLPTRKDERKHRQKVHKVYSCTGQSVPNQPLYTVAELDERRKSDLANDNSDAEKAGERIGDIEEKKDSVTDLLNFSLKRKPDVKELKYTLARILLQLEKNENNEDLGVLENYIKAKYAATHERLRIERSVLKANELTTQKESRIPDGSVTNTDAGEEPNKQEDVVVKNAINLEESTFYENSVGDLNDTNCTSTTNNENSPELKEVQSETTTELEKTKDTPEDQNPTTLCEGKLSFDEDVRFTWSKRRCKSASQEESLSAVSSKGLDKSPVVLRPRRARIIKGNNLSEHRIKERSTELVTYTTSCEVQETLTILESTKSENYSLMTSGIVSSDSECSKPFSNRMTSSDETLRKPRSVQKKSLTDVEIKALKEKIKTRRLKSKVTLTRELEGNIKPLKNSTAPPSENMSLAKKAHDVPVVSQDKNNDESERRRALIRRSMMRLLKERTTKDSVNKAKTPERPMWKP